MHFCWTDPAGFTFNVKAFSLFTPASNPVAAHPVRLDR